MANKRMFSKEITNSDVFLDLSLSSQALYFHLGMNADDDGFVQPKSIIRLIQAKEADLIILAEKGFIIPFQNSVVVLTHWKINNDLKIDRVKPTIYQQHLHELSLCNKIYIQNSMLQNVSKMDTECIQNVSKMDTQYSIVEYSIEEGSQEGKCQADDIQEHASAKASPKVSKTSLIVNNLINYWEDETRNKVTEVTKKQIVPLITKVLKDYDANDCQDVIDYIVNSEYHITNGYTGLLHIFRTTKFAEKLERARLQRPVNSGGMFANPTRDMFVIGKQK